MTRLTSLVAASVVLVASSAALAGEPTGRYQGAIGSVPNGMEQVYVDHSGAGRGGVTAAFAANIPAGQGDYGNHGFALLQLHGRAYMVTAMSVPNDDDSSVRLASRK